MRTSNRPRTSLSPRTRQSSGRPPVHPFQVVLPEIHVSKSSARKSVTRLGDYQTIGQRAKLRPEFWLRQIQGFRRLQVSPVAASSPINSPTTTSPVATPDPELGV